MKDFDMFYDLPAEIRQHKNLNYSVTLIGGPAEYKDYMEKKKERLAIQAKAKQERYVLARAFLADIAIGKAPASPEALAVADKNAELGVQFLAARRKQKVVFKVDAPLDAPIPPRPTWFQKVRSLFGVG